MYCCCTKYVVLSALLLSSLNCTLHRLVTSPVKQHLSLLFLSCVCLLVTTSTALIADLKHSSALLVSNCGDCVHMNCIFWSVRCFSLRCVASPDTIVAWCSCSVSLTASSMRERSSLHMPSIAQVE